MHSTLKLRESDPHDVFTIAPEAIPVAWADKVLADITRDANHPASDQRPPGGSGAAPGTAAPALDTNFRATAADIHVANDRPAGPPPTGSWAKSTVTVFLFALCSAFAAAAWQHYGGAAKQMISDWTPPFALTSSPTPEPTGLTGQPDAPAVEPSTADQAPPQNPTAAQPPEATTSAAAAASPDAAQVQSMARDLANMGQQIELLKATVAELKTGQQAMARDVAKPSEIKPLVQNPRPRISAPPPRAATAPSRRPIQAYAPVQAAAPPLPQQFPPPAQLQPAPPPQLGEPDGEPVVRPPMPLR
jgi:hypothetical protein